MRAFFVAIVVVAIGYLGWVFYKESRNSAPPALATAAATPPQETPPVIAPEPASARQTPNIPPRTLTAPKPSSQAAPPGVFYAVERVTVQTATGVKALHPGEEVRLMYRYKDGSLLVTTGHDEFVLKPSALTKDRELAHRTAPR